eukprot:3832275-Lingulodinium_polyedra.AAC.1
MANHIGCENQGWWTRGEPKQRIAQKRGQTARPENDRAGTGPRPPPTIATSRGGRGGRKRPGP